MSEAILKYYEPKSYIFEPQKKFVNDKLNVDRILATHAWAYNRERFIDMLYSSWYSIQQSNTLKELYRIQNNITYDYVMRIRFDICYNIPVICSHYDSSVVNISNRQLPVFDMVDDRFAFSNNDNMNIYSSGFNFLDYYCNYRNTIDGIFCGETLVYEILKLTNIENRKIHNLNAYKIF